MKMNKRIVSIIGVLVAGMVLAATGWNFKATAEIPEKYVTKDELKTFDTRNYTEHQRILRKLDEIHVILIEKTN